MRIYHDLTGEDEPGLGHNSYRVVAEELRRFVERYERLEAEKKDIADQQKEVMAEAKGRGYDTKVMRKLIALRKRDRSRSVRGGGRAGALQAGVGDGLTNQESPETMEASLQRGWGTAPVLR